MFKLKIRSHFDAAHRLPEYQGKCQRIHGHTWFVEVEIRSKKLNKQGMVCDFFDVRRIIDQAIKPLDHVYINEIEPFDRLSPTSENIAKFIYDKIREDIKALASENNIKLTSVTVYESPKTSATYQEE